MRRFVTLLTLLITVATGVAFLGAAGCKHAPRTRAARSSALLESAKTFSDAIRWQRYRTCGRMVAEEISDSFRASIVDVSEDLQITEGEVLSIDWPEDSEAATVRVRFRWVQLPSITEQTVTVEQRWEDRTNRGWTLAKMESPGGQNTPFDVL
jgi:hypothetical protein